MTSVENYKKKAKRLARANGTSHQAELNVIAKQNGHTNWGSFLASQTTPTVLDNLPENFRELEIELGNIADNIVDGKVESKTLSALLFVETLRASKENRSLDLRSVREWLADGLNKIMEDERYQKERAHEEGRIYTGNSESDWMHHLATQCHQARPFGRAYAQLKQVAAMAPSERTKVLLEILPALTDRIDYLQEAA